MLLRLAEKAFRPGAFPFPLLHVDTGHNFPEVIDFRDRRAAALGERLIVRSVEDSIAAGRVVLRHPAESRNAHQSVTLLDAIAEFGFDACIGGARRDEEKARAKERIFSFRDAFGQWDPKRQRPELWNLYNARTHPGENVRVFPISNWTELDVWQYIARERLEVPSIYLAHRRAVIRRGATLVAVTELTPPRDGERVEHLSVRFRTVGDITCTAPVASTADHGRGHRRGDRGDDDHRARRDAPRRPDARRLDGIAQAAGLLLMSARDDPEVLDHGVLRFLTAGSVDDGKSTLIGRLLYDTKAILADQLAAIERTSQRRGQVLDLSLFTDGLVAEREQGITIDVAYRYFATALRKFIIADAPGHEQYTRNMVTAASTAQLAVLLVDARHGIVTQTRRHATLAHLLGIPHLVVAVNKMDLVGWRQDVFEAIVADFRTFAARTGIDDVRFVPMSALDGDMVVDRGARLPVVRGPDAPVDPRDRRGAGGAARSPVPLSGPVCAPDRLRRSRAGTWGASNRARSPSVIASSRCRPGSRRPCARSGPSTARCRAQACTQRLTLVLADELDISRGDLLADDARAPPSTRTRRGNGLLARRRVARYRGGPTSCATRRAKSAPA